jgi:putative transposase
MNIPHADDSNIVINQELLDILQPLMEPCDRNTYSQGLKDAAEKLGKSKRTVQRLMKLWQEEGLQAFTNGPRLDKGRPRMSEDWQKFIVKTYEQGNQADKKMTPAQVALKVKVEAAKLGDKCPSHMSVYRLLAPIIERRAQKKSLRSPGWQGSRLVLKTRDGQDLAVEYSNQVWQSDHTPADILLVDTNGNQLGRPWLTTVVDTYSRCVVGFNLGFDAPSSTVVALALRHAILPKTYDKDYDLHCSWGTYGVPAYFFTDGGKDFRSNHLQQIGSQLGFTCYLRRKPSEGGIVERVFGTLNTQLFSTLPGYTGSNVQERPERADKDACLTIKDLERHIVRFLVDNYNQTLDARMGDQTRFQRWESGLIDTPILPTDRELDLCLMKSTQRRVQRGGIVQFENMIYKGENLLGYEGKQVSLRYDPNDITTVWVYRRDGGNEEFLTRAFAHGLEITTLTLADSQSARRELRQTSQSISNSSILAEVERREQDVAKTVKARRQKAQAEFKPPAQSSISAQEEAIEETQQSPVTILEPIKTWDLDEEY